MTKDVLLGPMHILLEGVIPKEITLLLRHAVLTEHWFTRAQLNTSISQFKFSAEVSKSDYPRLSEHDLNTVTSASAAWVLAPHLPLMLKEHFAI